MGLIFKLKLCCCCCSCGSQNHYRESMIKVVNSNEKRTRNAKLKNMIFMPKGEKTNASREIYYRVEFLRIIVVKSTVIQKITLISFELHMLKKNTFVYFRFQFLFHPNQFVDFFLLLLFSPLYVNTKRLPTVLY